MRIVASLPPWLVPGRWSHPGWSRRSSSPHRQRPVPLGQTGRDDPRPAGNCQLSNANLLYTFAVRIITLNVNGIRSAASKGFFDWARRQRADAEATVVAGRDGGRETRSTPEVGDAVVAAL